MKRFTIVSILLLLLVAPLAACSSKGDKVTIGALPQTEAKILSHMMKYLIEQDTDLTVEVKEDINTSPIILEGMQQGDIDIAVQYTGTSISSFTEIENPQDAEATLAQAKELFGVDKFNFAVLDRFGFANTYAFTITQELADKHGYETVSDLRDDAGNYNAGFDTAWLERTNDGYPAFKEVYDIEFGQTNPMEIGLVYEAVRNGNMDIVLAYSTDPRIVSYDLKLLEDDKNFFPPYDAVPFVRQELLDEHPEIAELIQPLLGAFDETKIAMLSGKVDNDGEEIKDVAKQYLEDEGLLK